MIVIFFIATPFDLSIDHGNWIGDIMPKLRYISTVVWEMFVVMFTDNLTNER